MDTSNHQTGVLPDPEYDATMDENIVNNNVPETNVDTGAGVDVNTVCTQNGAQSAGASKQGKLEVRIDANADVMPSNGFSIDNETRGDTITDTTLEGLSPVTINVDTVETGSNELQTSHGTTHVTHTTDAREVIKDINARIDAVLGSSGSGDAGFALSLRDGLSSALRNQQENDQGKDTDFRHVIREDTDDGSKEITIQGSEKHSSEVVMGENGQRKVMMKSVTKHVKVTRETTGNIITTGKGTQMQPYQFECPTVKDSNEIILPTETSQYEAPPQLTKPHSVENSFQIDTGIDASVGGIAPTLDTPSLAKNTDTKKNEDDKASDSQESKPEQEGKKQSIFGFKFPKLGRKKDRSESRSSSSSSSSSSDSEKEVETEKQPDGKRAKKKNLKKKQKDKAPAVKLEANVPYVDSNLQMGDIVAQSAESTNVKAIGRYELDTDLPDFEFGSKTETTTVSTAKQESSEHHYHFHPHLPNISFGRGSYDVNKEEKRTKHSKTKNDKTSKTHAAEEKFKLDLPEIQPDVDIKIKKETTSKTKDKENSQNKGFNIKIPKFGFGGKKPKARVSGEMDAPDIDVDANVDKPDIDANISIDKPDMDVDVKGPDVNISGEADHDSHSLEGKGNGHDGFGIDVKMPKFQFGGKKPSGRVSGEVEGPELDVDADVGKPEIDANIDIKKPDVDIKGPEQDVSGDADIDVDSPKKKDKDHGGFGFDIKMPKFGFGGKKPKPRVSGEMDAPDIDVDANVDKPDIDANISIDKPDMDVDVKGPDVNISGEADHDSHAMEGKGKGHGGFGFDVKMPKFKFGGKKPSGRISGEVEGPELDVDADVGKPEIDANVDIKKPDVDIKGPEQDVSGDADIDVDYPKKKDKDHGGFGFDIKMPKFGFGGKKPKPRVSGEMDAPDIDVDANVDKPDIDANISIDKPDMDVDVKGPDVNISGEADHDSHAMEGKGKGHGGFGFDVKMPKFKFGGKKPSGRISGEVEGPELDVDADVGKPEIDANVDIKKPDVDIKGPEQDVSGDADIDVDSPKKKGKDHGGFGVDIKMPKFGFGGKKPKARLSGEMDAPDIDVDANVDKPDIDANISIDKPDIDVDVKGPDVNISGEADHDSHSLEGKGKGHGGFGFDVKMPKFKFWGKKPSGRVSGEVEGPELDVDADVGKPEIDANVDIKKPDVAIKGSEQDVSGDADIDVDSPKKKGKDHGGFGFDIKMPKFGFGGKKPKPRVSGEMDAPDIDVDANVDKPDIDANISIDKPDMDVDVKGPDVNISGQADHDSHSMEGNGKGHGGFGFDVKMPKFKFGGKKPSGRISGEVEGPELDVDADVGKPEIDANVDIKKPDVDIKGPEQDVSGDADIDVDSPKKKGKDHGGFGFDIKMPKFGFGVKKPKARVSAEMDAPDIDVDANVDKPDIDANISIDKPDMDVDVKGPDVNISGEADHDSHSLEGKGKGHGGIGIDAKMPEFKFGGKKPSGRISGEVEGLELDVGADVGKPEIDANIDIKKPDVDVKGPELDVSGDADIYVDSPKKKGKDHGGFGFDIKMPKFGFGGKKPKARVSGEMDAPDIDVDANVDKPDIDANISIGKPDIDVDVKGPDVNISGEADHDSHSMEGKGKGHGGFGFDVKMPKFKFGGKKPSGRISGEVEGPELDVDADVGKPEIDANVDIKKPDVDIKGPELDVSGDADIDVDSPKKKGKDHGGFRFDIKMPKFGFGGKKPKARVSGEMDAPDIEVDANVDKPDIDANISIDKPDVDVDVKGPDVNISGEADHDSHSLEGKGKGHGGIGIDAKMPKFKFGGKKPSGRISGEVKGLELDVGADVGKPEIDENIDNKKPDVDIKGSELDVSGDSDIDVESPKKKGKVHGGFGFDIKMPKFGFGGKKPKARVSGEMDAPDIDVDANVDKPDIDANITIDKPDMDVDVKGPDVNISGEADHDSHSMEGKGKGHGGFGFDVKMPKFKFGGKKPSGSISGEVEGPELDVDADVGKPEIDANVDIKKPDVDIKGPKLDVSGDADIYVDSPKKKGKDHGGFRFDIKMPKFGFGGKKPKARVSGEMDAPDIEVDANVDKPDIDANISIDKPDVDLDVKGPDVNISGEADHDSHSLEGKGKGHGGIGIDAKMPKFQFGGKKPSGRISGEVKGLELDVGADVVKPEIDANIDNKKPDVDIKGSELDVSGDSDIDVDSPKKKGKVHGGFGFDIKMPKFGFGGKKPKARVSGEMDAPVIDADANVDKPDIDANITIDKPDMDVDVKGPDVNISGEADHDSHSMEGKGKGHGGFGFDVKMPKFKFGGKNPSGRISGEVEGPELDVDADVGKPEIDANVDIKKTDVDIKGPELDVSGDADIDVDSPKKKGKDHGGFGFDIKMPKFGFGGKKPKARVSAEMDAPDIDVDANVDKPDIEANISIDKPDMDVDVKGPDVNISGEADHDSHSLEGKGKGHGGIGIDAKMPKFKFGGKKPSGRISGEVEGLELDVRADVGKPEIDANIDNKKPDVDIKGPELDVSGDADIDVDSPKKKGKDHGGFGFDIKMPKFGFGGKKPKARVSGEMDAPDIDVDANVDKPDIDANISIDKPDIDVDVKGPDVNISGEADHDSHSMEGKGNGHGGFGFDVKMPKFKFGGKKPSGRISGEAESPELDVDADVGKPEIDANVDIKKPDVDIKGPELDVSGDADIDVDSPKKKGKDHGGFRFDIKMPKFGFGGKKPKARVSGEMDAPDIEVDANVDKPDIDANISIDKPDVDLDVKGPDVNISGEVDHDSHSLEGKGKGHGGIGIDAKMPKFKFGGKNPSGRISGEVKGLELDVGADVGKPEIDANIDNKKPYVDIKLSELDVSGDSDIDVDSPKKKGKVHGGFGFDIKMPKFGFGGKKPKARVSGEMDAPDIDVDANVDKPDIDANITIDKPDMDVDVKGPDVNISGEADHDSHSMEGKGKGHGGFGFDVKMPKFKFGGKKPSGRISGEVEGPELDVDADVGKPEIDANVDIKKPDVDIKGPELDASGDADIDVDSPKKKGKDHGGFGFDIKMPKFGFGGKKPKARVSGEMDAPDIDVDANVDKPDIDANISIDKPDMDVDVKGPDVNISGEADHDSHSLEGKGKRHGGFGIDVKMPNFKFGGKKPSGRISGEVEGPELDVDADVGKPEIDANVDIKKPDVDIKGPELDVSGDADIDVDSPKKKGKDHGGFGFDIKMPKFGFDGKRPKASASGEKDEPDIDMDANKPKIYTNISIDKPDMDVDVKGPDVNISGEADHDSHSLEGKGKGHGGFGIDVKVPKFKFGVKKPSGRVSGEVEGPELDVDADVGKPEIDANVDIKKPDVDIKGPELDVSGDADINVDSPKKNKKKKKKGKDHGGFGFDIKMPKFGFGRKKPKVRVSAEMDASDIVVDANVDKPDIDANISIDTPDMDVDVKGPDVNILGEADHDSHSLEGKGKGHGGIGIDAKMPKFNFGGKNPSGRIPGEVEGPELDVDADFVKPEIDANLDIKKPDVDIKGPELDVSGDADIDVDSPKKKGKDHGGFRFDIKMPKFGFGGKKPKARVSGEMDAPDIDVDANVDQPDIDANISIDKPDMDVDVKRPDVNISGEADHDSHSLEGKDKGHGGFGIDVKMPKFKFGGKKPSGRVSAEVEGPELDVDSDVGKPEIDANIDIKKPDVDIKGPELDVSGDADIDVDSPKKKGKYHGGFGFDIKMPKFGFGGKKPKARVSGEIDAPDIDVDANVDKPDIDANISIDKPDMEVDVKGPDVNISGEADHDSHSLEGKGKGHGGFGFDVKMPKFQFGGKKPSGRISGEVEGPELDVDADVGKPEIDANVDIKKHDVAIKGPELDDSDDADIDVDSPKKKGKDHGGFGFDIKMPKFGFGGKKPKARVSGEMDAPDINMDADKPDIDANISIDKPDMDVDVNGPDVNISGEANHDSHTLEGKGKGHGGFRIDVKRPKLKFGGINPSERLSGEVEGPEFDVDGDVGKPEIDANIDSKNPDVDIKGPELDVSGDANIVVESPKKKQKKGKDRGGFGFNFKMPKFGFGGNKPKARMSGEMGAPDFDVDANVNKPVIDANISIDKPDKDVDVRGPDVNISGEADHDSHSLEGKGNGHGGFGIDVQMPKFKFVGKKTSGRVPGEFEGLELDVDAKVGKPEIDANVDIKKPYVNINRPELDVSGDADIDIDSPKKKGKDLGGFGFDIKMPKFGFGGKKPKTRVSGEMYAPYIDMDADKPDIDANISLDKPDMDVDVKGPDVNISGEAVHDSHSLDGNGKVHGGFKIDVKMPKFKFGGMKSSGRVSGEVDGPELDAHSDVGKPEIDAKVDIKKPDVDIKGPELDVSGDADIDVDSPKKKGKDHGGFMFDIKMPKFGFGGKKLKARVSGEMDAPDIDVDANVDKPDIDANICIDKSDMDVDVKGPDVNISGEADHDSHSLEGKGNGHGRFGIDVQMPKLNFGGKNPSGRGSGEVEGPELDVDADVGKPEIDAKVDIMKPDIDIKGPDLDVSGDADIDVDIQKKIGKDHGGFGFDIKMPKFGFGGKKPKARVSVEMDAPDIDVDANVDKPDIDANISKDKPDMDVDVKGPDVNISGEADHDSHSFKGKGKGHGGFGIDVTMPKFNFGGKKPSGRVSAEVDGPELNVKADVGKPEIDANADIKKPDVDINGPELDVSDDADINVDSPKKKGKDHSGFGFDIKMPKLGFGGKKPNAKMSREMDAPDIDIDADKPDIAANISIDKPDMDVDVKGPDVNISGEANHDSHSLEGKGKFHGGFGIDVKRPKFKFGGDKPSGRISGEVEGPELDVDADVGKPEFDANVVFKKPDVDIKGPKLDVSGDADIDVDIPKKKGKDHVGFGFDFKMPKFGFGGKKPKARVSGEMDTPDIDVDANVDKPDIDANISIDKPDMDVNVKGPDVNISGEEDHDSHSFKGKGKGHGGFGIDDKMPKFNFGGQKPSGRVSGEVEGPELDGDADVGKPEIDANVDIKKADVDIKGPELDVSGFADTDVDSPKKKKKKGKDHGGFGFNFKMPKFGFGGKKQKARVSGEMGARDFDLDANVKEPDIDANISIDKTDKDVDVKGPDVNLSEEADHDSHSLEGKCKGHGGFGIDIKMPKFKFRGKKPSGRVYGEVEGPELGVHSDVAKPEIDANVDIKKPDVDVTGPELDVSGDADIDVDSPKKKGKDHGGFGFDIKIPKFGFGGKKPNARVSDDMDAPDIDMEPGKPDIDANISIDKPVMDVDVKGPDVNISGEADHDSHSSLEGKGKGHGGFGIDDKMPKFKFGGKKPSERVSGEVECPELDIDADVGKPEIDANVDIKKPDVDIKGPELDASGDADIDVDSPKMTDKDHGGFGFDIKMPKFGFGEKKPNARVSGEIDSPDIDVDANVDKPDIDANISIDKPDMDVDVRPDVNISGEADHDSHSLEGKGYGHGGFGFDVQMPKLNFGGKKPSGRVSGELEGPELDVDADVGKPEFDANVEIMKPDVDIKGSELDVSDDADIDVDSPKKKGKDHRGFGFDIKMPKFGFDGKKPKARVSGEMDTPDIDTDANKPKIDTNISIDKPDIDEDVKGPDVNISGEEDHDSHSLEGKGKGHGGFGIDVKMPKFKFMGKKPSERVYDEVECPDLDVDADVGKLETDANVDITKPDVDIKKPKLDVSVDANMDLDSRKKKKKTGKDHGGFGFNFKMPKFGFGEKTPKAIVSGEMDAPDIDVDANVDMPDIDANISIDQPDMDVDVKGPDVNISGEKDHDSHSLEGKAKGHGGFGIDAKMPEFKFGAMKPSGRVSGEVEGRDLDIDAYVGKPEIDANVDIKKPDVDLKGSELDVSGDADIDVDSPKKKGKDHGGFGFDIKMPKFGFGGKKPKARVSGEMDAHHVDVDANVDKPDIDANISIDKPDTDVYVKGPDVNISREADHDSHALEGKGESHVGYGIDVKSPQKEIEMVDVCVKEEVNKGLKASKDVTNAANKSGGFSFSLPKISFGKKRRESDSSDQDRGSIPPHRNADADLPVHGGPHYEGLGLGISSRNQSNIPQLSSDTLAMCLTNGTSDVCDISPTRNDNMVVSLPQTQQEKSMSLGSDKSSLSVGPKSMSLGSDTSRVSAHAEIPPLHGNLNEMKVNLGTRASSEDSGSAAGKSDSSSIHSQRSASHICMQPSPIRLKTDAPKLQGSANIATKATGTRPGAAITATTTTPTSDRKKGLESSFSMTRKHRAGTVGYPEMETPYNDGNTTPLNYYAFPIENVVLHGKGSTCIAHTAVAKVLSEAGVLDNVKRWAASGFGTLVALLLACGFPPALVHRWMNVELNKLIAAQSNPCLPVVRHYGSTTEDRLHNWLGSKLKESLQSPDATFLQLKVLRAQELVVIVTNASRMREETLSVELTPNLPLRVAVRMALAYQGMLKPLPYALHGDKEDTYASGALLRPFPLHVFDDSSERNKTVGVLLESREDAELRVSRENSAHQERPVDTQGQPGESPVDPRWLSEPMIRFLQTLHQYKVDQSAKGVTRADLDNVLLQRDTLPHDDLRLLFDNKRSAEDIIAHVGARNKNMITYKELLAYFEKKLQSSAASKTGTSGSGTPGGSRTGSLGRGKAPHKFESVFLSVQEALASTGATLNVTGCDLERTITVNLGDMSSSDVTLENNDRLYLVQEGQHSTAEFLRRFATEHDLDPLPPSVQESPLVASTADTRGGALSASTGYRSSLTQFIDDDLSEIINTSDYNENCRFVGDYSPEPKASVTLT